jgi:hypothetical protein
MGLNAREVFSSEIRNRLLQEFRRPANCIPDAAQLAAFGLPFNLVVVSAGGIVISPQLGPDRCRTRGSGSNSMVQ